MSIVYQDKKKEEFYKESVCTLESVKKNLIDFVGQFENFVDENHDEIAGLSDVNVLTEIQKGK